MCYNNTVWCFVTPCNLTCNHNKYIGIQTPGECCKVYGLKIVFNLRSITATNTTHLWKLFYIEKISEKSIFTIEKMLGARPHLKGKKNPSILRMASLHMLLRSRCHIPDSYIDHKFSKWFLLGARKCEGFSLNMVSPRKICRSILLDWTPLCSLKWTDVIYCLPRGP